MRIVNTHRLVLASSRSVLAFSNSLRKVWSNEVRKSFIACPGGKGSSPVGYITESSVSSMMPETTLSASFLTTTDSANSLVVIALSTAIARWRLRVAVSQSLRSTDAARVARDVYEFKEAVRGLHACGVIAPAIKHTLRS